MQLIIVESPSKAKTIEKYLGGKYRVAASGGHVRDLPEKRLGVSIANDYEPNYVITAEKKNTIKVLQNLSDKADKVYLATDPDREGEAISWHLQEVLGLKGKSQRIVFNEISERAVRNALASPRDINYNLVDSQQARRVLDRLVGYKLSPFLCKKIKDGLSAGRVQSVALRLVVDREREILAFKPQEYWNLYATFSKGRESFKTILTEENGKKYRPSNQEEAEAVFNEISASQATVGDVKKSTVLSHALAPFTTSTLQQDASNKLGLSSPQIMSIAQHLYEGVDTADGGHLALVTYIRTDSVRVAKEAQEEASEFIRKKYGDEYVPSKPNFYRTKKSAQDAHEAIRPIDVNVTPESVKSFLDKNHYNVYKLIYDRFIASQMSEAKYEVVSISVNASVYTFKTSVKNVVFKGFTAVYDDFDRNADEDEILVKTAPKIEVGEPLKTSKLEKEQKFTKPPTRYTDATLVKAMEDKGIGRPSTYASIISVLSKRKYTKKEGKFILPTEIAFTMTDTLVKFFPDIMDVSFTANMEDKLDDIENGGDWKALIAKFYPPFKEQLTKALSEGDEITDILCDKCRAPMVRKTGKYGKFLACSNYPECSNIKAENVEVSDVVCDKCGEMMIYKTGKYGKFLACPNYPKCSNIKPLNETKSEEKCEKCGGEMVLKTGKFGKYLQCVSCKATRSQTEKVGVCPKCGKPTQKMTSKSGKQFYGCSNYPECNFMSWDVPTGTFCEKCGQYLVISKDGKHVKCSNKECGYSEKINKDDKKN